MCQSLLTDRRCYSVLALTTSELTDISKEINQSQVIQWKKYLFLVMKCLLFHRGLIRVRILRKRTGEMGCQFPCLKIQVLRISPSLRLKTSNIYETNLVRILSHSSSQSMSRNPQLRAPIIPTKLIRQAPKVLHRGCRSPGKSLTIQS